MKSAAKDSSNIATVSDLPLSKNTQDIRYSGIDALLLAATGPEAISASLMGRQRLTEGAEVLVQALRSADLIRAMAGATMVAEAADEFGLLSARVLMRRIQLQLDANEVPAALALANELVRVCRHDMSSGAFAVQARVDAIELGVIDMVDACERAHFRSALVMADALVADADYVGLVLVSDRIAAVKRRIEAANFPAAGLAADEALKSIRRARDAVLLHSLRYEARRLERDD